MNYAIIDLEFTAWKGSLERNWKLYWENQEIIQIGAIKFNSFQKFTIKNLNIYIKPNLNKQLSTYIQTLTGISQYQINELGMPIKDADIILKKFFKDVKKIYCNGLDKEILKNNYKLAKIKTPKYIENIYNIRPMLKSLLNVDEKKIISSELHNFFKIKNNNKNAHNGLYDCYNIFNCLKTIDNIENLLVKN